MTTARGAGDLASLEDADEHRLPLYASPELRDEAVMPARQ
jgi:hypothetical protein